MSMPKISVIIPCYNYAKFLSQSLLSIMLQKEIWPNIEILVIDDGSTDETRNIIKDKYPNVEYIYQDHEGVSVARNKGIEKATGEYILFLDADDILAPECLYSQTKMLDENKEYDGCICHALSFYEKLSLGTIEIQPLYKNNLNIHICYSNIAPIHSFLLRKEVCIKNKFENNHLYLEDYAFFLKCIQNNHNFCSNEHAVVFYRRHESVQSRVKKSGVSTTYIFDIKLKSLSLLLSACSNYTQKNAFSMRTFVSCLAVYASLLKFFLKKPSAVESKECVQYIRRCHEYTLSAFAIYRDCEPIFRNSELVDLYLLIIHVFLQRLSPQYRALFFDLIKFVKINFSSFLSYSKASANKKIISIKNNMCYTMEDSSSVIKKSLSWLLAFNTAYSD